MEFYYIDQGGGPGTGGQVWAYTTDHVVPMSEQSDYGLAALMSPEMRGLEFPEITEELQRAAAQEWRRRHGGERFQRQGKRWAAYAASVASRLLD